MVLPYLGDLSEKVQKRIKNAFHKAIPWGKLNLTFKTHSRISHLFRFKDPVPDDIVSKVIYSYTCPNCNIRYIGETERHCKVRWGEHLGISCFTGFPVIGINTAIRDHLKSSKCNSDFSDFRIIGHESIRLLRELKESLFIHQLSPELNKQIKSAKLFLF